MKKVFIIGGGASGLTTAIKASISRPTNINDMPKYNIAFLFII